jgi:hypothetical protein
VGDRQPTLNDRPSYNNILYKHTGQKESSKTTRWMMAYNGGRRTQRNNKNHQNRTQKDPARQLLVLPPPFSLSPGSVLQFISAPRIKRAHTRVACKRSLVSVASSRVGLKKYRNMRGASRVRTHRLSQPR